MPRRKSRHEPEFPKLDWTLKGWKPRRRDQGYSTLCTPIQTVVTLEGMEWAYHKTRRDLSEQQIIEAFYIPKGGFKMKNIRQQYRRHPWVTTTENYPVNIINGEYVRQKYNAEKVSHPMVGVGGWKQIKPTPDHGGDYEKALLEAVNIQPVLAFIASDSEGFHEYVGNEIFRENISQKPIDHAVVVIGYGTSTTTARTGYWILLNSWGPDWGKKGCMRMLRGQGLCGIGKECYIPIPFDKWQSEVEKDNKEKDNKRERGKREPGYKPFWKRVKRGR